MRLLDSCALLTTDVKGLKQHPARGGHVFHCPVEWDLIGLRRSVKAADFANELESRVVQLSIGRRVIGVPQPLDVPTHCTLPCSWSWSSRPTGLKLRGERLQAQGCA